MYADWVNTGGKSIRAVLATVRLIGPDGRPTFKAKWVTIYAAPAGSPGVAPGEEYRTPEGKGVAYPDGPELADVPILQVEITGASE